MNERSAIVITSINGASSEVLQTYAHKSLEKNIEFIVIGDRKSPADFNLTGCRFLNLDAQKNLGFRLSALLPENSYARKNLGYLLAIKNGCEIIVETDDDNLPLDTFWQPRSVNIKAAATAKPGWQNMYRFFSEETIWPRGFPLEELGTNELPDLDPVKELHCPIQQGLADGNPDVDAVYRLTRILPVNFSKGSPIVLGSRSFCPFNSQNTTWFKEAFALMYIPSTCNFRVCDIWRSFVALPILRVNNWHLSFHEASVFQNRNEHNLLLDFENEIPGYLRNKTMMAELDGLTLKKGEQAIPDNLRSCYRKLVELNVVTDRELILLEAWLEDLASAEQKA